MGAHLFPGYTQALKPMLNFKKIVKLVGQLVYL